MSRMTRYFWWHFLDGFFNVVIELSRSLVGVATTCFAPQYRSKSLLLLVCLSLCLQHGWCSIAPSWSYPGPASPSNNKDHPTRTTQILIGAVFPPRRTSTDYFTDAFENAIRELNNKIDVARSNLTFHGRVVRISADPRSLIKGVCDDVIRHNLAFLVSYYDCPMLTYIAAYTKTPILLLRNTHTERQERSSMHFYLRPSVESYAEAMLAVLDQKNMKQFTVISDNSPTGGALVRRIREITDNDPSWVLNDVVMFSKDEITAIELYKVLQKVKETKVIILQSSLSDAVRIFNIAGWLRMTGIRYTWVVSEHVVIPLRTKINKYPKNILAVKSPGRDPWVSVIHDAVHLGAAAVVEAKLEHRELPALQPDCWSNSVHNPGGELVQRYLTETSYQGRTGYFSFNKQGVIARPQLEMWMLETGRLAWRQWINVGSWQNQFLRLYEDETLRNTHFHPDQKLHLRVVTFAEMPFVNVDYLTQDGVCINGVECLMPNSSDPKHLDLAFRRFYFEKKLHISNRTEPVYCCYGISIDMLRKLSKDMQFSYDLYVAMGNDSGVMERGQWTGAVADVIAGAADMIAGPFFVNSVRQRALDISQPYFYTTFSLMVTRRDGDVSMSAFMEPLDWSMWVGIFVTANIAALSITLYEWHSPFGLTPYGRDRQRVFSLSSALTLCWSILFSHTVATKKPKCWSSKFITNSWACFSLVFLASYTANLAAFMVGELKVNELTGINDRRIQQPTSDYKIVMVRNSNVELYLKINYPHLFPHLNKYRVSTTAEAIDKLSKQSIDVFIVDQTIIHYYRRVLQNPKLRLVGKEFGNDAYAIALSLNSPLTKRVNLMISRYVEDGSLEETIKLWLEHMPGCSDTQLREGTNELTVLTFAGVFLLFSVGIAFGVLTLIFECLAYKYLVPCLRRRQWVNWLPYSQRLHRTLNSVPLTSKNTYTQRKSMVLRPIGERLSYHYARRDSGENSYDLSRMLSSTVKRSSTRRRLSSSIGHLFHRKSSTQTTAVQTDVEELVNHQLRDVDANIELRLLSFERDLRELRERLARALTEKEELMHRLAEHEAKSRDQLEGELQQRTRGYGFDVYGRSLPSLQYHPLDSKSRQVHFSGEEDFWK